MSKNYFENLRTVGAKLDKGIKKLQEIWKMPHLLLCKNNEDEKTAKNLVENLRNELKILKETLEDNKITVSYFREIHTKFIEESVEAIRTLKEEVDDTKVLFIENGYNEESVENDLSISNSQFESLLVNKSDSFIKNSDNVMEITAYENVLQCSNETKTPTNNVSFISIKNKSYEQPVKPLYSPYYYKIIKK